jgi:hypothetical protein
MRDSNPTAWNMWRAVLSLVVLLVAAGADAPKAIDADVKALASAQAFVGQWRGVGQPKRGSNQGAWTEESEWVWRFADGRAELVDQLSRDKYFNQLRLQAGEKRGEFVLLAMPAGDGNEKVAARRFAGARVEDGLVFTAVEPLHGEPARISLRLVAGGDRMLVLYEKRTGGDAYARLAEVGSTRKGSSFAKATASGPECVVTGGLGTIAVEHNGKTYHVCCTGCRDLFRDDPEGVLAEYRKRKADEAAEKKD